VEAELNLLVEDEGCGADVNLGRSGQLMFVWREQICEAVPLEGKDNDKNKSLDGGGWSIVCDFGWDNGICAGMRGGALEPAVDG
jgi:hypothetical protein